MSFVKKLWKNRQSQHPSRRIMTRVDTGTSVTYDVERDEGTVSQVGDDFSAENMNDLEDRIESAFNDAGGGAFVGVKYHASLEDFPGYPCWEDLTVAQKEKFDINNGATVNFLDDEAPSDIIGDTDISGIADGTLTGAVAEHETEIAELNSALTDSGTIKLNNSYNLWYRKVGKLVTMWAQINTGSAITTLQIGTLPSEYRPPSGVAEISQIDAVVGANRVSIRQNDGLVRIISVGSGGSGYCYCTLSYYTN